MRTDKLREALEWIEQNPHKHDQDVWAAQRTDWLAEDVAELTGHPIEECGTAYCLAGVLVVLNDGEDSVQWRPAPSGRAVSGWLSEANNVAGGRVQQISERAVEILEVGEATEDDPDDLEDDVTRLFDPTSTLSVLRGILAKYEEGASK